MQGAPSDPNPLLAGNLSASNLVCDVQGNTTKLADESLTYDASGNNTGTTLSDGTKVAYQRDVSGTVVSRTSTPPVGTATTIWYSGPFVLTGTSGAVVQTTVSLPGGATVEIDGSGTKSWSYPDLHGDNIVQADGSGARIGTRATYDPFGQPIDPVTGCIGTNTADDAVADTSPGAADQAWAGGAGKLYEHGGDIATIEMGAREYLPGLARFLQTDAVLGGNVNDYSYPNDPIDDSDYSGNSSDWDPMNSCRYSTCATAGKSVTWAQVGQAIDLSDGVLGVGAIFGCVVCAAIAAPTSIARGVYKVSTGDADGWWDIAGGATFGAGRVAQAANEEVKALRLARIPLYVRGTKVANAAARSMVKAEAAFVRSMYIAPYLSAARAYGYYDSARFVIQTYNRNAL